MLKMIMRTGINTKIIVHWILVILVTGTLFFFIEFNKGLFGVLIGFSITTLIFNQTTYLYLRENQFMIIKKNFLFLPTYRKMFDLTTIKEISMEDNNAVDLFIDFEGAIIPKILTGSFFYESKYILSIISDQDEVIEIKVNIPERDMTKMKQELRIKLKNKFIV